MEKWEWISVAIAVLVGVAIFGLIYCWFITMYPAH